MNTKLKSRVLSFVTEEFARKFIHALVEESMLYKAAGVEINESLPQPLRKLETLNVGVTYLENIDYLVFQFTQFSKKNVYGGYYKSDEENLLMESFIEKNDENFEIEGALYQVLNFKGLESVADPDSFLLYFSFDKFIERLADPRKLAAEIIRANIGFRSSFLYYKNSDNDISSSGDVIDDKTFVLSELKSIAKGFQELIDADNTPELKIDKYLEENPVILKEGLKLEKFIHQSVLENFLNNYTHDFKPDLIAYNIEEKRWVIVDYKKANKNVLKNTEKTRTGLTAEVHSLKDQLRDYRDYFGQDQQRDRFKKKYHANVVLPSCIGVIGTVEDTHIQHFNRVIEDEPRWYKVVPYNYLYDNFIYYINTIEKFA